MLQKNAYVTASTDKMQSESINRVDLEEKVVGRAGRPARLIRPKMDVGKALSIMGFTSARALDQSGGNDAISELNAALSKRMDVFEKKKRIAIEKGKKIPGAQKNPDADKARDELRTLHEAYQFLSKKYIRHMKKRQEQKLCAKMMSINLDEDEWNIEEDDDYEPPVYENDDDVFIDYRIVETVAIDTKRKGSSKK